MYRKRMSALILGTALVVFLMNGCGGQTDEQVEKETQTQQEVEVLVESETENSTEVTTEEETEEPQYPEITSNKKIKDYKSIVVIGDSGYELYTYLDDVADNYAKSVNSVADSLKGKADVYNVVIPLSSGIMFPDNLRDQIKSSDQREAIDQIHSKLDDNVHVVDIYDSLMQHRNEYIYFRTDHHWTTLGAYYAYEDFCEAKGIEPEALDSYETQEFEDFLGSFYNDSEDAKLKANPDTITAYYPKSDCILHVTASDGTEYDWPIIYDVSNYSDSLKYSAFAAGDNPFTVVENKDLTDGSSCIVVKESFGNAFVPFLVDHYQTIYVIDYRYWTGSISEFAEQESVDDVIFLNNLSMIRNKSLVGKLYRVK